jgi:hypothetical protein
MLETIKKYLSYQKKLKFLKNQYNCFNDKYFSSMLPKISLTLETEGKFNGRFSQMVDLKEKRLIPVAIRIDEKVFNDYKLFRNTLVHEMVHFYDSIKNPLSKKEFDKAKMCFDKAAEANTDEEMEQWIMRYREIINKDGGHTHTFKSICHELNEEFSELCLRVKSTEAKL